MFILKKGHQPGVYVPLRALFLVHRFFKLGDDSNSGENNGEILCHPLIITKYCRHLILSPDTISSNLDRPCSSMHRKKM